MKRTSQIVVQHPAMLLLRSSPSLKSWNPRNPRSDLPPRGPVSHPRYPDSHHTRGRQPLICLNLRFYDSKIYVIGGSTAHASPRQRFT